MPKIVYDNFLGGLTPYSLKIGKEGSYPEARDVDPHRDPGFIKPGWIASNKTSSSGGVLAGLIVDAVVDVGSNNMYALDSSNLYKLTNFGTTFTNDATWPHAITGISRGEAIAIYPIGTTNYLFYFYEDDFGRFDLSSTFDDDFGSTVPTNAGKLNDAPHPVLEWEDGMLYFGNGRYLGKFDGQTGTNGTLTLQALDLPQGWEITQLFSTHNYIGICAWKKTSAGESYRTQARVFFWDGVSSSYDYSIPIEDNKIISALNNDGEIYLITRGRGFGNAVRRLIEEGDVTVAYLKTYVNDSLKYFYVSHRNAIEVFQNRILIGACASATGNYIFAFGRPSNDFPEALLQPFSSPDDPSSTGKIGLVRQLFQGAVYVSSYDSANYYWQRFVGNYSSNAVWKGRYFDTGQKITIKWVKYYFKQLVSGDNITVSIDTDYGTSHSLGTITYSSDGAVMEKRFDEKIPCYSFRPVIQWSAGGTAFSKIVINYTSTEQV